MSGELSTRAEAFISHYLSDARYNAAEAARLAGYSEVGAGQRGWELLQDPRVAARINEALRRQALDVDTVVSMLSDIARGPGDYIEVDPVRPGLISVNIARMKADGKAGLIKKLTYSGRGQLQVEFYNRLDALDKLARTLHLFGDRAPIEVRVLQLVLDNLPEEVRAQVVERLRAAGEITP